ncbi:hypothetical protein G6M16_008760 [Agrobacterium tumefaciens]|nr:hypothetical protein G6M16_008760 [Agrobacterium tumefaciens]
MYTIVVDERERERQFENGINKAVRHCKIGKVTRKVEARDLSSRVRTIVDGLIGSQPEKEGDPGRGISGGILMSLADNAEDTLTELRRANDELSRLSKVLGLAL